MDLQQPPTRMQPLQTNGRQQLFGRRFLRGEALQRLYGFFVRRQAYISFEADRIRTHFVIDPFLNPEASKALLQRQSDDAVASFLTAAAQHDLPKEVAEETDQVARQRAEEAWALYQTQLRQDVTQLKTGFASALHHIEQACIQTLQLFCAWHRMAQHACLDESVCLAASHLSSSPLLNALQNASVSKLGGAPWSGCNELAKTIYRQHIERNETLAAHLQALSESVREKDEALWTYLCDRIVMRNTSIEAFFSRADVYWRAHKPIVRRVLHVYLRQLLNDPKALRWDLCRLSDWQAEQNFYERLIDQTLEKEAILEACIAKHSAHWSMDRIVLLDKTLLKLGMCELLYFSEIPNKISIDEYVTLAKLYGSAKSAPFVNGLLDAVMNDAP